MAIQRTTLAIDFSPSSIDAAAWAARHFAPGAEHVLVHCLDGIASLGTLVRTVLPEADETLETLHTGAEQRLREIAAELGIESFRVRVVDGRPHEEIAKLAHEDGSDVIVVAEHGEHHGLRRLLGSVPDALVRSSRAPVLVARGLPAGPPRSILVAVDDSPEAARALSIALDLGQAFGSRLVAVHVVSTWYAHQVARFANDAAAKELQNTELAKSREWLEEWLGGIDHGGRPLETDLRVGSPEIEIVTAAARHSAELVVVGTRGSGGVLSPHMGSVARFVVHDATCPVLAVGGE